MSRPSSFDPAFGIEVCEGLAKGETQTAVCERLGVHPFQVSRWLKQFPDSFGADYAQAKALQIDRMADEVLTISDETIGASAAEVQSAKLRTDNRKWLLSKLASHTYGDKLDVTSKGEALAAPSHMVDARVQSIVMQAAMRMKAGLDDEALSLLE